MTCAKVHVEATLVTATGERFTGTNAVSNPQATCPRVGKAYAHEDYRLCHSVCQQPHHAEVAALLKAIKAGARIRGSTVYVNHSRVCNNCARTLHEVGVSSVICY